jgi:hypothetical protein
VLAGILTVAVIAVGLPLLAWWVGGRGFWTKAERRGGPDPFGDVVRRHRLGMAEQAQVQSAVQWGRHLDDPRLRVAAVELARTSLTAMTEARSRSRIGRLVVWLGAVYALLVVAGFVFALSLGRGVPFSLWFAVVNLLVTVGGPWWAQRTLRRAIQLNSDGTEAAGGQV